MIIFRIDEAELEEKKRRDEKVEKKKTKDLEKRREKRRIESEQRRNENVDRKRKFEGNSVAEEPKFKKPAAAEMLTPPPTGFKADVAAPPGTNTVKLFGL